MISSSKLLPQVEPSITSFKRDGGGGGCVPVRPQSYFHLHAGHLFFYGIVLVSLTPESLYLAVFAHLWGVGGCGAVLKLLPPHVFHRSRVLFGPLLCRSPSQLQVLTPIRAKGASVALDLCGGLSATLPSLTSAHRDQTFGCQSPWQITSCCLFAATSTREAGEASWRSEFGQGFHLP